MTERPTRFVLVDQSLRDFDGHHFEYDLAVVRAAAGLGLAPSVVSHRDFAHAEQLGVPVLPWFADAWHEANRDALTRRVFAAMAPLPASMRAPLISLGVLARRTMRSLRRKKSGPPPLPGFGASLKKALAEQALLPDDHVLVHTLANSELHALLAAFAGDETAPHLHVVLRRDAEEPAVATDPWGGLPAAWQTVRADRVLARKVHFYSDTSALAEQYDALFAERVTGVLPIPHCLPDAEPAPAAAGPARIVYLGNARSEKGFHLLPDLVEALWSSHVATGRARFVLQCNHAMSLEEVTIDRARKRLAAYPEAQVQLIDRQLDVAAFQALLFSADLVLLPYRADLYRRRSSGILIQAAVAGVPVVVPAESWLDDAAVPGAHVSFAGPADLARAVAEALERLPELQAAARAAAPRVRDENDATALVEQLLRTARG